ncbi:MAG: Rrf2 family transcriptional regulator [Planctomycetota bacterium]
MFVSARAHYATLALLELAIRRDDDAPVTAAEITRRHGVPGPFLTQIMRTLRSAGWVQSIRGASGGFRLAVDPAKLTLMDIVRAMDGPGTQVACRDTAHGGGPMLAEIWNDARAAFEATLAEQSLECLTREARRRETVAREAPMYFI